MSAIAQVHDQKQSTTFKQILMATDFSDASQRAFAYAVAIAHRYRSALSVVHAIPPDPHEPAPIYPLPRELDRDRMAAEKQMKQLDDDPRIHDLNHRLLLEQGPVWDVLASVIQREQVDLLVMGTRGRGGLKKLALGSVAEEVLRLAPCPVLTVGPNVPAADSAPTGFRRILFATDLGPTSAKAFPFALSVAEDYQAKLVLVHMVPPIPISDFGPPSYCPGPYAAESLAKWEETARDESATALRKLLPPDAKLAAEPEYVVGIDFVPEGILQASAARKVELIVMGAFRTSSPRMSAHMPWALAHEVICHAQCPVLTVSDCAMDLKRSDYVP